MLITFPQNYVGISEFERVLQKNWSQSFKPSETTIEFDLTALTYLELPQLCLLFGWVESLLTDNKAVSLFFGHPSKKEQQTSPVFRVALNYGFFTHLSRFGNRLKCYPGFESRSGIPDPSDQVDSPLIHLTVFATRQRLETFISSLDPIRLGITESLETRSRELLSRTGVRDVFLKELGQNVFDHAKGSPALIAVARRPRERLLYPWCPVPFKKFAERIIANEFIQVAVLDLGPGIPETLNPVFMQDEDSHEVLNPKKECSVIEYAFWKDTTSKPKRAVEEMLDAEEIDEGFIPPTGLYFVENLAKNRDGLVYVRSSRTIFGFYYSSQKKTPIYPEHWKKQGQLKGRLAKIPGTLVVAFIPVNEGKEHLQRTLLIPAPQKRPKRVAYLNLGEISRASPKMEGRQIAKDIISAIRKTSRRLKASEALIIDFEGIEPPAKYLYKMILYGMYRQERDRPIIFTGFPLKRELDIVIQEVESNVATNGHLLPLLYFDEGSQVTKVIGASLVGTQTPEEVFEFGLTPKQILTELDSYRLARVKSDIKNSLHSNAKALLPWPSSGFVKDFFELSRLLQDPESRKRICDQLVRALRGQQYSCIVAVSPNLDNLARMLSVALNVRSENVIVLKSKPPTIKPGEFYKEKPPAIMAAFQFRDQPGKPLLLADVMVTAQTVQRNASLFKGGVVVATLVDGRPAQEYPSLPNFDQVICLLKYPLEYHFTKPTQWHYDDIRIVDHVTHLLSEPRQVAAGKALWKSEDRLSHWAKKLNAVRCGHFYYGDIHYNYFFQTYQIVEEHKNEIVERVRQDVEDYIRVNTGCLFPLVVTHLCYPQGNRAAEGLCDLLQPYLGGRTLHLARISGESETSFSTAPQRGEENAGIMLFVDTAATTSQTLQNAMMLASNMKAHTLLAYFVINRISGRWPRFIDDVNVWRGMSLSVRSLVRADLPAHTERECSLCQRHEKLHTSSVRFFPAKVRETLYEVSRDFLPYPITEMRNYSLQDASYDPDSVGKQIAFRQRIEGEAEAPSYAGKFELLNLLQLDKTDDSQRRGIISCVFLEGERFLSDEKYKNVFDGEFLNGLFDLAKGLALDQAQPVEVRSKSIWVASLCNAPAFLRIIPELLVSPIEDLVKHVIATVVCHAERLSASEVAQQLGNALLTVQSNLEESVLNLPAVDTLRELASWFRFKPDTGVNYQGSYAEAIRILESVFYQPGRTHPDIRRLFDDAVRIVDEKDLKRCVEGAYLRKDGLFEKVTREILPALRLVGNKLPREVLSDFQYLISGGEPSLIADLYELDFSLRLCLDRHKTGNLSGDTWKHHKARIRVRAARLLENVFKSEASLLRSLLTKCTSRIGTILDDIEEKVSGLTRECGVDIVRKGDGYDVDIAVPFATQEDVVYAVVLNAILYSVRNSTILIHASREETMICLRVSSNPLDGHHPRFVERHGLLNASRLLQSFDCALEIGSVPQNAEITMRLTSHER